MSQKILGGKIEINYYMSYYDPTKGHIMWNLVGFAFCLFLAGVSAYAFRSLMNDKHQAQWDAHVRSTHNMTDHVK